MHPGTVPDGSLTVAATSRSRAKNFGPARCVRTGDAQPHNEAERQQTFGPNLACGIWDRLAALWDRCFVMASILRKPSNGGQSKTPNLSTRRGALHLGCVSPTRFGERFSQI